MKCSLHEAVRKHLGEREGLKSWKTAGERKIVDDERKAGMRRE